MKYKKGDVLAKGSKDLIHGRSIVYATNPPYMRLGFYPDGKRDPSYVGPWFDAGNLVKEAEGSEVLDEHGNIVSGK